MKNGSGNKHQQRTEATRAKLLKAARRIFARDGFEAARIEDIAALAGHTRGAFYAHFASKEDLFFALVEQLGRERFDQLGRLLESCSSAEERLAALRDYYVKRIPGDRQLVVLMMEFKLFALRHGRHRARLAAALRRVRAFKTTALQSLLPARVHVNADSFEARRTVLEAALNGLVIEHAYDPLRISEAQVAFALKQVFDMVMSTR